MKSLHEHFIRYGADSLSESELLSLICGSEEEATMITETFSCFQELARENYLSIAYRSGVSRRTAQRIDLCFEISRRYRRSAIYHDSPITSPEMAAEFFFPFLRDLRVERFMVLFLSNSKQITSHIILSSGTSNATLVDPKMVLKEAIVREANSLIVAHNHPSGFLKESAADIHITKRITEACNYVGITLDDHIIICRDEFISFRTKGLL